VIGRGSERGAPDHWFYETYDLALEPGEHMIVAQVWSLGADLAANVQMRAHHGFLFAPEGEWTERLGTGFAAWEAKILPGYRFLDKNPSHWRHAPAEIDGARFAWGFERGQGEGWSPTRHLNRAIGRLVDWAFYRSHRLIPAMLPPMLHQPFPAGVIRFVSAPDTLDTHSLIVRAEDHLPDDAPTWSALIEGRVPITIPANTRRRAILDLQNYVCAYWELRVSGGGGAIVRVHWAEALHQTPNIWDSLKGHRDEIYDKYLLGRGERYLLDGAPDRRYRALWWEAGRYVEIAVQTADDPLTLQGFQLDETRYPLEMESRFEASDPRLIGIMPLLVRGVQMCAGETYLDCPYYEELAYVGDNRLEALTTYIMTRDDRLPRKSITMFDASRLPDGMVQSRYPCEITQVISGFSLWWTLMVRDYALWRDDPAFVRSMLPGVRSTLEGFRRYMRGGLLIAPDGWNVTDWVATWEGGIPPAGVDGFSGVLNWHLITTLTQIADLERGLGDPLMAARWESWAADLVQNAEVFWDEARGLFADDLDHQHFSEHTQSLAILSGLLTPERAARVAHGLINTPGLAPASIYFSHYLFEALREVGRVDVLLNRLALWHGLIASGLKTPIEQDEPTRSDCHGWGSHPLFHYFATLLGIRPGAFGFREVIVEPQLGGLTHASGVLVHPQGEIHAQFELSDGALRGSVRLPDGVTGTLIVNGQRIALAGGETFTF